MYSYHAPLVLITGTTGHIGFRTLIHALSFGYSVRAAVRSSAKAKTILSHPQIRSLNPGSRLTFVIVPDLTAPNAYDEAAQDCESIIHIASPLMMADSEIPLNEQDDYFVKPAVKGTLNMLKAAKKSRTVQRVVITSSITALIPIEQLTGEEYSSRPVQATDRIPFESGPYESEFAAYAGSKVAALHAAESWMAKHQPAFDVIHLHPAFVEGRNDLVMTPREALKGTNAIILGIVLGKTFDSTAGVTVHNEDVARTHVQALDINSVPGNMSYILSQQTRWNDVRKIVRREFPEAVAKRTLPNSGSAETHKLAVDTSLTEAVFDFQHIGFEEQVKSVVGHYLELRAMQRMASRDSPANSLMQRALSVRGCA